MTLEDLIVSLHSQNVSPGDYKRIKLTFEGFAISEAKKASGSSEVELSGSGDCRPIREEEAKDVAEALTSIEEEISSLIHRAQALIER